MTSAPREVWEALGYEVEEDGDLLRLTVLAGGPAPKHFDMVLTVRSLGIEYNSSGQSTVTVEVVDPPPARERDYGRGIIYHDPTELTIPIEQIRLAS